MAATLAESLTNQIPASNPWLSIAKYLFVGVFIAFLVPYWSDNHPAANDVLTKGTVVNYETTSTGSGVVNEPPLIGYSPVIVYQDKTGASYTNVIPGISDRKPFAVGQQVDIYYKPQQPTMMMLADNPYHAWTNSFYVVISIPFFLVAALYLCLILLRKPKKTMDTIVFAMPFVVPFLIVLSVFIAFGFHLVDIPQMFSYRSDEQTWSSNSTALTVFMMILVAGILIYVARWPLIALRMIRQAAALKNQPQETAEQILAKTVPPPENPNP